MKQISLAESGLEHRPKATRRQQFLAEMEHVVPWERLLPLVAAARPTRPG